MKATYSASAKITGFFAGLAVLVIALTVVFACYDDPEAMKILAFFSVPVALCTPLPPLFFFRYELDFSDPAELKGRYFFRYRTIKLSEITEVYKEYRGPNIVILYDKKNFYVNYRNCKNTDKLVKYLVENVGDVCTDEIQSLWKTIDLKERESEILKRSE